MAGPRTYPSRGSEWRVDIPGQGRDRSKEGQDGGKTGTGRMEGGYTRTGQGQVEGRTGTGRREERDRTEGRQAPDRNRTGTNFKEMLEKKKIYIDVYIFYIYIYIYRFIHILYKRNNIFVRFCLIKLCFHMTSCNGLSRKSLFQ